MNTSPINLDQFTNEFEKHVVTELAELKTDMKALVGNGQPGRMKIAEDRIIKIAIAIAILTTITFGPKAFEWFLGAAF